jgi:spore germination protein PE
MLIYIRHSTRVFNYWASCPIILFKLGAAMKRTSIVNDLVVTSVTSASNLMVGDSFSIKARTRALAVQRQGAVFFADGGEFEDYPIFTKEIPMPTPENEVQMRVVQQSPYIKVRKVKITGVAAASTLHIGSLSIIDIESRIKFFKHQLLSRHE